MMQHQVAVQARFNPETLERVLRVVRHRGFQICSMNMETATDAQNINIELTVASPRPVELLFSQLTNWSTLPMLPSARAQPHHNKSAPERKGRKMTTKKADYIWFNGEMVRGRTRRFT
jgi:acetolactate synthase regulatory subunit